MNFFSTFPSNGFYFAILEDGQFIQFCKYLIQISPTMKFLCDKMWFQTIFYGLYSVKILSKSSPNLG
jgi:hypothetical protein